MNIWCALPTLVKTLMVVVVVIVVVVLVLLAATTAGRVGVGGNGNGCDSSSSSSSSRSSSSSSSSSTSSSSRSLALALVFLVLLRMGEIMKLEYIVSMWWDQLLIISWDGKVSGIYSSPRHDVPHVHSCLSTCRHWIRTDTSIDWKELPIWEGSKTASTKILQGIGLQVGKLWKVIVSVIVTLSKYPRNFWNVKKRLR